MEEIKKFTAEDARLASAKNELTYEQILGSIKICSEGQFSNRQCNIMGLLSGEIVRSLLKDGYNISTIVDQLGTDITIIKW